MLNFDNPNNFNISFNQLKNLLNIGTKLSDFEEIKNSEKNYTLLGKGNFGYAEKMRSKINNSIYAIKKLNKFDVNFHDKDFLRETENMMEIDHENIVKLYGYFEDFENIYKYIDIYQKEINEGKKNINNQQNIQVYCLVLEYVKNGSLENYDKNYKKQFLSSFYYIPIEQNFIIKIFKQLLSALIYLQTKSIMHRDIKLDNILLDENFNIKIADFGVSALFKDKNPENLNKNPKLFSEFTMVGRIDFMSPEITKGQKNYDYRCDIYSLGLTILWLMSREKPIKLFNINGISQRFINITKIDQSYNIYLRKLVLRMINEDQNLRPYANQAYDELINIEELIKNPNNNFLKKKLDEVNNLNFNQSQNNQINFNNNNMNFQNNQNNQNINIQNNLISQNNLYNFMLQYNLFLQNNQTNFMNIQNNFNFQNNEFNFMLQKMQNNFNFKNNEFNFMLQNIQNNFNFQNNQTNFMLQNIQNNFNFQKNENIVNNMQNLKAPKFPINPINKIISNFQNNKVFPQTHRNFRNPQLMGNNSIQKQKNQINYSGSEKNLKMDNFNLLDEDQKEHKDKIESPKRISKNTSLIRVLQIIQSIIKNSINDIKNSINNIPKLKKNNLIINDLINIFEYINLNFLNEKDNNNYSNAIQNFRNKLALKIKRFNGSDEIIPKWIFEDLFLNLNNEFNNNQIFWKNNIYDEINEFQQISKDSFPEVYEFIDKFVKEYRMPLINLFYFLSIEITKCLNCDKILEIKNEQINYIINLPSEKKGKVSDLIYNFIHFSNDDNNKNYKCSKCNINGPAKKQKVFLNSPKYIIIDFEGSKQVEKNLNKLDLTEYILSNKGPTIYNLYAFIIKEKDGNYSAYIKNDGEWRIYFEENEIEESRMETFNYCYPYIAIYKGE